MKTVKLLIIAALLMLVASAAASENKGKITADEDYAWHGFRVFGRDYVHPRFEGELSGIEIATASHLGETSDDIEYWDTSAGYTFETAGLILRGGYDYLIMPGADVQEISATLKLPGDIGPFYRISHIVPDEAANGQVHAVGADVCAGDPNGIRATLAVAAEYNDGVNPWGPAIRDWTHVTTSLVVDVPASEGITVHPGVVYQYCWEPEFLGRDNDEIWYTLGISYRF